LLSFFLTFFKKCGIIKREAKGGKGMHWSYTYDENTGLLKLYEWDELFAFDIFDSEEEGQAAVDQLIAELEGDTE